MFCVSSSVLGSHARGRKRSFGAGMAAADDDDCVLRRKTHDAESTRFLARARTLNSPGVKITREPLMLGASTKPEGARRAPKNSGRSEDHEHFHCEHQRRPCGRERRPRHPCVHGRHHRRPDCRHDRHTDVAAGAAPQIGQPAPDFTAVDSKGNQVRLSEYRGKTVVLEWTNADCPYTRKHYSSGNMQSVQDLAQKNGIVWLTVISSAPGKQGYVNGPQADVLTESRHAVPTAVLLDPSGAIGRLYGAKTTPHMFVIDKNGALQYMGGIDSIATTDVGDIARAEPYLKEAMLAVAGGNPAPHPVTKPYGCSVKY